MIINPLIDFVNKIICGDCLSVMPKIPDKSVDMILADLPYGTTACKWDTIIPFEPLWGQYKRIIKDNGAIVLTASQPFTSKLVMSNLEMFKYCWYWVKEKGKGHLNSKRMPLKSVEDICVFYNKPSKYNPQFTVGSPYVKLNCNKQNLNKGVYGRVKDSNDTINIDATATNQFGIWRVQVDASGDVTTRAPATNQTYTSSAAAVSNLPAVDASNISLGYIIVSNPISSVFLANSTNLTGLVTFTDSAISNVPTVYYELYIAGIE